MTQSHRVTACFGTGLILAALSCAGPAAAASQRTFVSTGGVDNPACSIASPCRTFGAAISATLVDGEVVVLDSGGYGPVTIIQSVSIIAPPGVYAGVSVFSGTGVTVTTALPATVVLRGLTITNIGTADDCILFNGAGTLRLANVVTNGCARGVAVVPNEVSKLIVDQSTFVRHAIAGIFADSGPPWLVSVSLDRIGVHQNNYGILVQNTVQLVVHNSTITGNVNGVATDQPVPGAVTSLTIETSVISSASWRAIWVGDPSIPGGTTRLVVSDSKLVNNGIALQAGHGSTTRLTGTTISGNSTALLYVGNGIVLSQGNNLIDGNTTEGTAPTIVGSK